MLSESVERFSELEQQLFDAHFCHLAWMLFNFCHSSLIFSFNLPFVIPAPLIDGGISTGNSWRCCDQIRSHVQKEFPLVERQTLHVDLSPNIIPCLGFHFFLFLLKKKEIWSRIVFFMESGTFAFWTWSVRTIASLEAGVECPKVWTWCTPPAHQEETLSLSSFLIHGHFEHSFMILQRSIASSRLSIIEYPQSFIGNCSLQSDYVILNMECPRSFIGNFSAMRDCGLTLCFMCECLYDLIFLQKKTAVIDGTAQDGKLFAFTRWLTFIDAQIELRSKRALAEAIWFDNKWHDRLNNHRKKTQSCESCWSQFYMFHQD